MVSHQGDGRQRNRSDRQTLQAPLKGSPTTRSARQHSLGAADTNRKTKFAPVATNAEADQKSRRSKMLTFIARGNTGTEGQPRSQSGELFRYEET